MNNSSDIVDFLAFIGLIGLLVVPYVWSVVWAYGDAKRRGKPGLLVALLVLFLWPMGLLIWWLFHPSSVNNSQ